MDSRVLAVLYYICVPVGIKCTVLLYHKFFPPCSLCLASFPSVWNAAHTHSAHTFEGPGLIPAESLWNQSNTVLKGKEHWKCVLAIELLRWPTNERHWWTLWANRQHRSFVQGFIFIVGVSPDSQFIQLYFVFFHFIYFSKLIDFNYTFECCPPCRFRKSLLKHQCRLLNLILWFPHLWNVWNVGLYWKGSDSQIRV